MIQKQFTQWLPIVENSLFQSVIPYTYMRKSPTIKNSQFSKKTVSKKDNSQ